MGVAVFGSMLFLRVCTFFGKTSTNVDKRFICLFLYGLCVFVLHAFNMVFSELYIYGVFGLCWLESCTALQGMLGLCAT